MGEPDDKGARRRGLCDLRLLLQCHLIQKMIQNHCFFSALRNHHKFGEIQQRAWSSLVHGRVNQVISLPMIHRCILLKKTDEWREWKKILSTIKCFDGRTMSVCWQSIPAKKQFKPFWLHTFLQIKFENIDKEIMVEQHRGWRPISMSMICQYQGVGRTLWKRHGFDGRPCSGLHSHVLALQVARQGGLDQDLKSRHRKIKKDKNFPKNCTCMFLHCKWQGRVGQITISKAEMQKINQIFVPKLHPQSATCKWQGKVGWVKILKPQMQIFNHIKPKCSWKSSHYCRR